MDKLHISRVNVNITLKHTALSESQELIKHESKFLVYLTFACGDELN